MSQPFDLSKLEFAHPAEKIKTVNVEPVPERITHALKKYEDSRRGFGTFSAPFEHTTKTGAEPTVFVTHRPDDAQVAQIYRMHIDPSKTGLERVSHFSLGTGTTIASIVTIDGDNWRGVFRGGGAILTFDTDGREYFSLWRMWEDQNCSVLLPKIEGELDNTPGTYRIERLTHNPEIRYSSPMISKSNKLMLFASTEENGSDYHTYLTPLIDSQPGAKADASPLILASKRITPLPEKGNCRWHPADISSDDRFVLLTQPLGSSYRPLYLVDISGDEPTRPEMIVLPGMTEKEEETVLSLSQFSHDPTTPHLLYLITDAFGDFKSLVTYDLRARTVLHITTPEPSLRALHPVPWDISGAHITSAAVFFQANIDGMSKVFMMPLGGAHVGVVVELVLGDWVGGISFRSDWRNARPLQLLLSMSTYRTPSGLAHLDMAPYMDTIVVDANGAATVRVEFTPYANAQAKEPDFDIVAPTVLRFNSFDGLEVPVIYYHPHGGNKRVPLLIDIHGGPTGQAGPLAKTSVHCYVLNEMGCAVMRPNVRGSSGYGKRYMAADDVEKREDSVKDIGALLDYIKEHMKDAIDASAIAVMGGSYGGYMTFACLTHYSPRLRCGVATCGIAQWPSFLRVTASHRRAHRRREYGDETDPAVCAFLERISPANSAARIAVPLWIGHGEQDSRVPIGEAYRMWDNVVQRGIHCELVVGVDEGHGFKQKSVIEYANASKVAFLERYLLAHK